MSHDSDSYDYDLFVIGAGSGGTRAARIAGGHGARVAIAEESRYGGTCVVRGCIPKKLFVYASEFHHGVEDGAGFGWTAGKSSFDWQTLVANKDREIDRLTALYQKGLDGAGVERFDARAVLSGPHSIDVAGKTVTARTILVATGGTPFLPNTEGIKHAITSNEAFHLESLPTHVTVVGGGYIAVEFAHIFRGLGCETALVHRRDLVLRGFDSDVRQEVTDNLGKAGVDLRLTSEVIGASRRDDGQLELQLTGKRSLITDVFMCATGRIPNTAGLGLESAGVELAANGAVVVNDESRSSVPHIYAVGDCTDRINLTPVAIVEGHAFADTVFGNTPRLASHEHVASAVFCQPALATIGLTEEEARQHGAPIDIYKSRFRPLRHTLSGRDEKVFIKILVDRGTQRVIGAHIVAKEAPEIIQALAIAIRMGATKADLDATMAVHPTTAEELVLMSKPAEQ